MQFEVTLGPEGLPDMQPHRHFQFYAVVLVLRGTGTYLIERHIYTFSRNSLFILPPSALHMSREDEDFARYVVRFPVSTLTELGTGQTDFRPFFDAARHLQLGGAEAAAIKVLIERCNTADSRFGGDTLRNLAFVELLLRICEYAGGSALPPVQAEAVESRATPILEYIETHLREDLSLDAVADALFMSKYYLCHLFRRETGATLGEYILRRRLLRAQELLRAGSHVQRAAEESGFRNYAHFIRVFGQQFGIPPGRYARQYRQQQSKPVE